MSTILVKDYVCWVTYH